MANANREAEDPLLEPIGLLLEGDPLAALDALNRMDLRASSEDLHGRALAVEVACLDARDQKDARRRLDEVLRDCADSLVLLLSFGIELAELGETELAILALERLCALDPSSHVPRYNLGVVLEEEERVADALARYEEALGIDPRFAPGWQRKAACLVQEGRRGEAVDAYRKYLELEPHDPHEWISLAIVHSDDERWEQATRAFERAERLDPENLSLHYNWMVTAARRGDQKRLEAERDRLVKLAPEDWRTAMALASTAEVANEIGRGWTECERAWKLAIRMDGEALEGAASAALAYANRHGLVEHAAELVEEIFQCEVFDETVLDELRRIGAKEEPGLADWLIRLEGDLSGPDILDTFSDDEAEADDHSYKYLRGYRVFAKNEASAVEMAMAFETRCGGLGLTVESIERKGSAEDDEVPGVWWRAAQAPAFPSTEDPDA